MKTKILTLGAALLLCASCYGSTKVAEETDGSNSSVYNLRSSNSKSTSSSFQGFSDGTVPGKIVDRKGEDSNNPAVEDLLRSGRHQSSKHKQHHSKQMNMNLFEGDIIPLADEIQADFGNKLVKKLRKRGILPELKEKDLTATHKHGHKSGMGLGGAITEHRWMTRVNDIIEIPYAFKSGSFSTKDHATISNAMMDLERACGVIKFIPRKREKNYIVVEAGDECSSYVGNTNNGAQSITLDRRGCISKGIIQHEFLHALGFYHEQSRRDRDQYVSIKFGNISPNEAYNFEKEKRNDVLGNPYDYGSVMHYNRKEFSENGKDTIVPKQDKTIGQRVGVSTLDVQMVRLLYQCKSGPRNRESYEANKCTIDCKCWEGADGCSGDTSCQGSLVCNNNICQNQQME